MVQIVGRRCPPKRLVDYPLNVQKIYGMVLVDVAGAEGGIGQGKTGVPEIPFTDAVTVYCPAVALAIAVCGARPDLKIPRPLYLLKSNPKPRLCGGRERRR